MGRKVKIQLRRATPEDAAALAAVEVRSWRAAYRGLMPDAYLDFYEHLGWTFDGRTVSEDYGGCRLEALCYRRLMDASGAWSALLTSVLLPIEIMQTMR
jgi:hypothetical protein